MLSSRASSCSLTWVIAARFGRRTKSIAHSWDLAKSKRRPCLRRVGVNPQVLRTSARSYGLSQGSKALHFLGRVLQVKNPLFTGLLDVFPVRTVGSSPLRQVVISCESDSQESRKLKGEGRVPGWGQVRCNNAQPGILRSYQGGRLRSLAYTQSVLMAETVLPDKMKEDASVELDETEKKLIKTLLETLKFHGLSTTLRVAGGWVRDKLLGLESKDIDVALDDMLGKDFADKVNEYLESINEQTHTRHVIQSNPDQSKHLETASMHVHETSVDFVNLRAEEYASGSRIPTMVFGTPEQDAYRRDLTINSLFYNINTRCIEDFTNKGLADLRDGIIRTPLPPMQTFLDDPLRVLRAVRFASRFGFAFDPALVESACAEEVRSALEAKISRERVGVEVDKMLGGCHPLLAMRHLSDLGLFPVTFLLPPDVASLAPRPLLGPRCVASLAVVAAVAAEAGLEALTNVTSVSNVSNVNSGGVKVTSSDVHKMLLLAGVLLPLRHLVGHDSKKKPILASSSIILNALKLKADYAKTVAVLHKGAEDLHKLLPVLLSSPSSDAAAAAGSASPLAHAWESDFPSPEQRKRVALGLEVRSLREWWCPALVLATVVRLAEARPFGEESAEEEQGGGERAQETVGEDVRRAAAQFREAYNVIVGLGLERVWELKPLVNGREIMARLGTSGPETGVWVEKALTWQLANPGKGGQECWQWLESHRPR